MKKLAYPYPTIDEVLRDFLSKQVFKTPTGYRYKCPYCSKFNDHTSPVGRRRTAARILIMHLCSAHIGHGSNE